MDILNHLRGVSEDAGEPAPGKYVGQSESENLSGDRTRTSWAWPAWTMDDLAKCVRGKHKETRQRVVHGWIGMNEVSHCYCACGQWRWMYFNRTWVEEEHMESGGHERWIDGHLENLGRMAEFDQRRPPRP